MGDGFTLGGLLVVGAGDAGVTHMVRCWLCLSSDIRHHVERCTLG